MKHLKKYESFSTQWSDNEDLLNIKDAFQEYIDEYGLVQLDVNESIPDGENGLYYIINSLSTFWEIELLHLCY